MTRDDVVALKAELFKVLENGIQKVLDGNYERNADLTAEGILEIYGTLDTMESKLNSLVDNNESN